MSKVTSKSRPLPVDHEAAAQETERRESLAANDAYAAGIRRAQTTELENRQNELKGAISDLRRMRQCRGNFAAALSGYSRVYQRIVRLAETIAGVTGESIEIPEFDPPQELSTRTRTIGPPKGTAEVVTRPDGTKVTVDTAKAYKETKGKGPSGRGLPPPAIPGSAADSTWLETTGRSKK